MSDGCGRCSKCTLCFGTGWRNGCDPIYCEACGGSGWDPQTDWRLIAEQLAQAIEAYQNATPRHDWFGELDHALEHYRLVCKSLTEYQEMPPVENTQPEWKLLADEAMRLFEIDSGTAPPGYSFLDWEWDVEHLKTQYRELNEKS